MAIFVWLLCMAGYALAWPVLAALISSGLIRNIKRMALRGGLQHDDDR